MELQNLPVHSWLKKEISEFNFEFDTCGHNAPSSLDEALDCFGLVALGADVNLIESASAARLCACALSILSDDKYLIAWQKKQSDRGRAKITNTDIERAVSLVANRSSLSLVCEKNAMVKQLIQHQNGN